MDDLGRYVQLIRSKNKTTAILKAAATISVTAVAASSLFAFPMEVPDSTDSAQRIVTGKSLTPAGSQTNIGSFPVNMVRSPDGRYVIVTNSGYREYLTVLRIGDGKIVSQIDFNAVSTLLKKGKKALYYGLACGKTTNGHTPVYASRGGEGVVSLLMLDSNGVLTDTGKTLSTGANTPPFLAGLALSADGRHLYAADNSADPKHEMRSVIYDFDTTGSTRARAMDVPGYPYALSATTAVALPNKIYVTSEQRGSVTVLNSKSGKELAQLSTGEQPIGLTFNRAQTRLFVANAGSDTVSIIDTETDRVLSTILLRPDTARGLPGATPTGITVSTDEKRLFVTLADMNAVAVIDLPARKLIGYIPTGWYPTSSVISPDGKLLFIANAKGITARNPNNNPVARLKANPRYIQNIIEGTISTVNLATLPDLSTLTAKVLANNQGRSGGPAVLANPGIKHVFYLIKENRTYDQVLGDLAEGNGDKSICLFPREVTPNLHALAERFALLDNFYCCAEVSGDGWNWSTGAMASEYTARNVPHSYSGRSRDYDFEGTNHGVAVDRIGIPDAARPPGGYLWDNCAEHGISFRNYGFFADDLKLPRTAADKGTEGLENSPTKKILVGRSDADFRQFDTRYPDSEAYLVSQVPPAPKQLMTYGKFHDPSRVTAWKREFASYVKNGDLPSLCMLRVMRDHTAGTAVGSSSARAMVADNDYAVGQIVETISHSPYWKSSAIVIVEDDAQNGYDHVDAHRSIAFVISPFVKRNVHDARFYNTDSALRTIEDLLGMPPMTQYDAIAPPIDVFAEKAENIEPYLAIVPDKNIVGEINSRKAYRAADSARILNPLQEESGPDEELNDILWHAAKGKIPAPARRYSLSSGMVNDD